MVSTSSDPRLGVIRLAWWRERLEDLDRGTTTVEPRLQAVASELLPRCIAGEELSRLEDAWMPALEPFPWGPSQVHGFRLRGRVLFALGARLLGTEPGTAEPAGEFWSLVDGAQHCSDQRSRDHLLDAAQSIELNSRSPLKLRPLTILSAIAAVNARGHATRAAQGMAALTHRITGRIPRSRLR